MRQIYSTLAVLFLMAPSVFAEGLPDGRYLYVACPGIRNYLEFGGAGILIFDIDQDHKFVKRIQTPHSRDEKPDNVKGVCASAITGRVYFTTPKKLYCVDMLNEKTMWEKELPQGCDRMSMTCLLYTSDAADE